jgi:streptogramin lyase
MKKILLSISLVAALSQLSTAQTVWQVSTFAGNGTAGNGGDGGPATAAQLNSFEGLTNPSICKDAAGNLFVADLGNQCIRKITSAGVISTFATDIDFGGSENPSAGLCIDPSGNLYAINSFGLNGFDILKITPGGTVTTLVHNNPNFYVLYGMCTDAAGNIYVVNQGPENILKITPAGVVSTYVNLPNLNIIQPCMDNSGNMFVTTLPDNIIKITPSLVVSTFASGNFSNICSDNAGNIYAANENNNSITMFTPAGVSSTLIQSADGVTDVDACVPQAVFDVKFGCGLFRDASGNFYLSESYNNKIRKMQQVPYTPPVPSYNLPASMCLGSSANYQPATTGSQAGITVQIDSSIALLAPKAICRNQNGVFVVNANDSILFYNLSGVQQATVYNNGLYSNVSAIAADNSNRIYAVAPDPSNNTISTVYRFLANGNQDLSFNIPSFSFGYITAIAFSAADGYVYLADTTADQYKIDTATAAFTTLPSPSNLSYDINHPTSMVFGSNGQMYLADIGKKAILARNTSDNNYYVVDSLRGTHHSFSIDMDTTINNNTGNNTFYITSNVSPSLAMYNLSSVPLPDSTALVLQADTLPTMHLRNPMGSVYVNQGGTIPVSWIANTGGNNVMRVSVFAYSISPPLPAGLNYNFINGTITGSPTTATPFTTYTIVTQSTAGTNTTTIAFSVVPPGPVSNTVGVTSSAVVNQTDGLTVNYFNTSDCSQMLTIQDAPGGTVLGNTIATQTVYPTIATFSADTFVGRVTVVNTQEPDSALANITLNFTYQDIQHYNASVAPSYTLSNDTTVTKMMKVGILQMHTKNTGSKYPITHFDTAHWVAHDHQWEVKFAVTKFSTFYLGDSSKVTSFNCATASSQSLTVTGNYYVWNNDTLFSSGVYADTSVNKTGCDSIATLNLILNTTGISEYANSNRVYIYPNPSSGKFTLNIQNSAIVPQNIRVINMLGAEVYNTSVTGNAVIDLSSEESGVYYVIITSQNNTIVRRVVKQ